MQDHIRVVLMRGGTSKCAMFRKKDLPEGEERDRMLLSIFGSPDPRQIDGIGGAVSSTSKACIIAPSLREDADIDYTFGQVEISEPSVDYQGNCGNCSAAVGPFAIEEGLIPVREGMTTVRIFNTNTEKMIEAEVPVANGMPIYQGDFKIAGVPRTGAAQRLWFHDPGGSVCGKLLPTGNPADLLDLENGDSVEVTLVDAANPVVLVRAEALGLTGIESPKEIDEPSVSLKLAEIRALAAVRFGLVNDKDDADLETPAVPKVTIVGEPRDYINLYRETVEANQMSLSARMISMGRCHTAYPVTGAIATATAAKIPGSIVHRVAQSSGETVLIGHPSGVIPVDIDMEESALKVRRAGVYRTARRIFEGKVYY